VEDAKAAGPHASLKRQRIVAQGPAGPSAWAGPSGLICRIFNSPVASCVVNLYLCGERIHDDRPTCQWCCGDLSSWHVISLVLSATSPHGGTEHHSTLKNRPAISMRLTPQPSPCLFAGGHDEGLFCASLPRPGDWEEGPFRLTARFPTGTVRSPHSHCDNQDTWVLSKKLVANLNLRMTPHGLVLGLHGRAVKA